MDKFELAYKIFEKGYELGFKEMEVYTVNGESMNALAFNQEINQFSLSTSEGLSFRGIHPNGKVGYSFTEKLDISSVDNLVKSAWDNAEYIEIDEQDKILAPAEKYAEIPEVKNDLDTIETDKKLAKLLEMESHAKKLDKRVVSLNYCMYAESKSGTTIINTKGMNLSSKNEHFMFYISLMAKDGEEVVTEADFMIGKNLNSFKTDEFIENLVNKAMKRFGGEEVKSGSYPVVLENAVMGTLLNAYKTIFSADSVQNGRSMLKGKLGEVIANSNITIGDNPFLENSILKVSFDDEGVPTYAKNVLENGKLISFFHNTKTAEKDNVKSTGNASKGSYKAQPNVGMWNLFLESKDKSFDELVAKCENGVLITDLSGIHAGVNPVSGDFSLEAKGFLIENSKVTKPIRQMTVAGNFIDMLQKITEIGNDTKVGMSMVFSPSVLVENLDVSGA